MPTPDAAMVLDPRYFDFDEVTPQQAWDLLDWCVLRGANEFIVESLVSPAESERMKAFHHALSGYTLPSAPRRRLTAPAGQDFTRSLPRWRLNAFTVAHLKEALPMGFASREYDADLWLEDLTVYRDSEFLMGVLSHERRGVVRGTTEDLADLQRVGFPLHTSLDWIGY